MRILIGLTILLSGCKHPGISRQPDSFNIFGITATDTTVNFEIVDSYISSDTINLALTTITYSSSFECFRLGIKGSIDHFLVFENLPCGNAEVFMRSGSYWRINDDKFIEMYLDGGGHDYEYRSHKIFKIEHKAGKIQLIRLSTILNKYREGAKDFQDR